MLAVRFGKLSRWEVSRLMCSLANSVFGAVTGVDVPIRTFPVASSSVSQLTAVELAVILDAVRLLMAGAVVSGVVVAVPLS